MFTAPAATATAITAATATAAAAAFFARAGNVYGQGPTAEFLSVEGVDSSLRLFRRAHRDEGESARTAANTIHHQISFNDGSMGCERVLKIVFRGVEGKVSHEQF